MYLGDPWVAQWFSTCLWPGLDLESRVRLPAWNLLLPPPVSLPLSLSLCAISQSINQSLKKYMYLF